VDWTGKSLGRSEHYSRGIPVIKKDSEFYKNILKSIKTVEALLLPANPRQILTSLAKLRLHYATAQMTEAENRLMIHDYINDLSTYPIDIIEQSCVDYRRDAQNQFYPKIGQLIKIANQYFCMRKWKIQKLKALIEVSNNYYQ
jgi:hypothetical protein